MKNLKSFLFVLALILSNYASGQMIGGYYHCSRQIKTDTVILSFSGNKIRMPFYKLVDFQKEFPSLSLNLSSNNSRYQEYVVSNTDFSDGFTEGHCEGYKFVKGQYVTCPVAPVAPVPQVGQDSYKGGYNLGFVKGREKASE